MRPQRSWPHRFRVTVHTRQGATFPYSVVTWLSQEKAVAMAVGAHQRRHADGHEIYDITVDDLGPADRDARGAMAIARGDLTDRFEF